MKPGLRDSVIWLLLLLLTFVTYRLGDLNLSVSVTAGLLLSSMLLKSYFIIADYMGLRGCAIKWQSIIYAWLLIVVSFIGVFYFLSKSL